jgi:pimeloyl-ACP methyl ester carboxylesterase
VTVEDPSPPGRAGQTIGREALALVGATLLYPFGWISRPKRLPRLAEQRTVVLIHGYLANPSCFTALQCYLRLRGHRQILSYRYRPGDSVEASAIGLKAFLKSHVRGGRIDLVCHSLGGLVAAVYLSELGGARRVDRCITLGTPHRGTYNAYWILGRIGRDLRPGSTLLRRLRAARVKSRRVLFTSIVGAADNIILPRAFAAGRDRRDTVVLPEIGHMGLLFSPVVFRVVADRLENRLHKVTAA